MASLCLRHHFAPGGAYIAFSVTGVTSMLSKGKGVGMRVSGCLNAGVGMLVVVVNCPSQGAALPYPLPAIGFILGCMPSGIGPLGFQRPLAHHQFPHQVGRSALSGPGHGLLYFTFRRFPVEKGSGWLEAWLTCSQGQFAAIPMQLSCFR